MAKLAKLARESLSHPPDKRVPSNPAGKALDQQNIALRSEHDGEISYPAYYNFPANEGTLSMWIRRNGGGTYNTFFGAGNAIWSNNSTFSIFYIPGQKKIYFRYRSASKAKRLDAAINCTMTKNIWYHIACSWKLDKNGKMQLTAYLANEGKPVHVQTNAENWSTSIMSPLGMFGKKGRMWIGSGSNGMTPANSLIDEVMIWNKAMSFEEVLASEKKLAGQISLIKTANRTKSIKGKKNLTGEVKGI